MSEAPSCLKILAQDLNVTINSQKILDRVSLELPRGKVIGLVGPNGAGKSTLLRAILGLIKTQGGSVTLDGKKIDNWSLKERAKKISYSAQGSPVHWPLTVKHLVSLGRIPHLDPWQKMTAKDEEAIQHAMNITDTAHLAKKNTTTLSGGERACAMLARAIVNNAPYLFADEPVASLDPYHQLQVMDILKELSNKKHGVLVVMHDLALAHRYCDELLLLLEGKVLTFGKPKNVLTPEYLEKAYKIKASRWIENGESFLVPWKKYDSKKTHDLLDLMADKPDVI